MISFKDRIVKLLRNFGIEKAHFVVGGITSPIEQLSIDEPNLFMSLTLVCPVSIKQSLIDKRNIPFVVISGDRGESANSVIKAVEKVDGARHITLKDYNPKVWSDIASERSEELLNGIMDFLQEIDRTVKPKSISGEMKQGEVREINYRIQGTGPPLILFPLGLAPTQWNKILGKLSDKYCTFSLSGPHIEPTALLEARCSTNGYRRVLGSMIEEFRLEPRQSMLDAGCGTGAVVRWLAEKTDRSNPITGVDINPFLLREAEVLRDKAKLADIIEFIECDVLDLPFSDNSFDATFSTTMLEEVDADTAIAEIVRVTKPGGRIGSIVRAVDMVPIFGTVLPEGIMTKVQSTLQSIGANPNGCADISLYKKFSDAGLTDLRMLPQYDLSGHLRTALVELLKSKLNESELKIWNKKVGSAVDKGFFFIGLPMHVAVGTKK